MKLRVPRLFLLQALPQKPSAAGKQRQIAYVQALKTCKMEDQQHKPHRQSTDTEKRRQHAHAEPPDPNGFRQVPVGQDKAAHARRADAPEGAEGGRSHIVGADSPGMEPAELPRQSHRAQYLPIQVALDYDRGWRGRLHSVDYLRICD